MAVHNSTGPKAVSTRRYEYNGGHTPGHVKEGDLPAHPFNQDRYENVGQKDHNGQG
jgi:hypothetical protein